MPSNIRFFFSWVGQTGRMDPSEERGSKVFSALQAHRGEAFHSVQGQLRVFFSHPHCLCGWPVAEQESSPANDGDACR